jgi:hypothetical protein
MKIIDPGHVYELDWLDGEPETAYFGDPEDTETPEHPANRLIFIKREGPGYPGNVGSHPGTNIQEVLRVLIDRLKYLNNQIPDNHNSLALSDLREALWFLEHRAAERHGRFLKVWPWEIELEPTCRKCGHIGCDGTCHA